MNAVFSRSARRVAMGSMLLASGCQLDLDADLIKNSTQRDGGDASGPNPGSCPVGFVCTPVGDGGGLHADAGDDGGPEIVDDGGGHWLAEAGGPGCEEDSDCASDSFCSMSGACEPACDSERGCVVPNTGRVDVVSLQAAQGAIFWSTGTAQDALGNRLHDGAIWRMNESGSSTAIANGYDYPSITTVVGNDLYFFSNELFESDGSTWYRPLHRASTLGAFEPEKLIVGDGPVSDLIVSENYQWWTRPTQNLDDAGSLYQLFRRSTAGGAAELVAILEGSDLLAATDTAAVFYSPVGTIGNVVLQAVGAAPQTLGGANPLEKITVSFYGDDVIFGGGRVTEQGAWTNLVPSSWFSTTELRAPWVFWMTADFVEGQDTKTIRIGRTHADLAWPAEEIAQFSVPLGSFPSSAFVLSPWTQEIIYFHAGEKRFFRIDLPSYPCSNSIACPEGLACQPDQTCR